MKENATKAEIESVMLVTQEHHKRLGDLTATVGALTEALQKLQGAFEAANAKFEGFHEAYQELCASHAELTNEVRGALNGFEEPEGGLPEDEGGLPEDESEEQRATRVGLVARVTDIEGLVRGRNRSAPVKRNMTDADAVRVLTGDVKDLGHKEAGEVVGLTYAQVYSCRMEYTFKHVHKELRNGGWKNGFVK